MARAKLKLGKLQTETARVHVRRFTARDISFTLRWCEPCDNVSGWDDTTCGATICTIDLPSLMNYRLRKLDQTTLSALISQIRTLQKAAGKRMEVVVIPPDGKFAKAAAGLQKAYKQV